MATPETTRAVLTCVDCRRLPSAVGGSLTTGLAGCSEFPEFDWASASERVASREVELFGSATTAET